MDPTLRHLLVWSAGVLFLMYGATPLLIRFTQTMSVPPSFTPVGPGEAPWEVAEYFRAHAEALALDGFTPVAFLMLRGHVRNVVPYIMLLVNREAGDRAMSCVTYVTPNGVPKLSARYLEFYTTFEDNTEIDTSNSSVLGVFKKFPDKRGFRFPDVHDARQLYQIHREMLTRHGSQARKTLPDPGQELPALVKSMCRDMERQTTVGILFLDRAKSAYRPTVRGAYYMTWGQLWPMKTIRTARMMSQSRATLKTLSL